MSKREFDVLIIGAGPAGIAAACAARQSGAHVAVVDDNPAPGGQIWRSTANPQIEKFKSSGAELLSGARIFHAPEPKVLLAETYDGAETLYYKKLILATGARELFLPFPGWTLPNVMGAGALQAMVKSGLDIKGKRVIVAGSGPLLLAVAAYLVNHGAKVLRVAEQASYASVSNFGRSMWNKPAKLWQAFSLFSDLTGVPTNYNCYPIAAEGNGKLERVTLDGAERWIESCDYLACGFGLVPNTELGEMLGTELENGFIKVDSHQQTNIPHVYAAGEPTGIGGLDKALAEGRTAGFSATGHQFQDPTLPEAKTFEALLSTTYALRPELRTLADATTTVCRCEDVTLGQLTNHQSWREAKLHTRCGMGPCQGRICGPAVEHLLGWQTASIRPPLFPAKLTSFLKKIGDGGVN